MCGKIEGEREKREKFNKSEGGGREREALIQYLFSVLCDASVRHN